MSTRLVLAEPRAQLSTLYRRGLGLETGSALLESQLGSKRGSAR